MTHSIPDIYAQNYRAAQYHGKVAEKRRREALNALQEAQRGGDGNEITARLTEYSAAVRVGVKALAAIHAAFVAGVTAKCVKTCAKCGALKTPCAVGRMICRPCSRTVAAHGCARAAAAKIARRDAHGSGVTANEQKGPTAMEVFDAVCETHGLGASVPRMNPNAGRLKAGESLYPTKRIVAL